MTLRIAIAALLVSLAFTGRASAQVVVGFGAGVGPGFYGAGPYGNGLYPYPWGYGRYAPWGYPGLAGGPYLNYPFVGWPGYTGAFGSFWTNGLSLYGPPVPTYGPTPGVLGNSDFVNQWRHAPTLGGGVGVYGWFGPYRASPRYRNPSVSVRPIMERVGEDAKIVVKDAEAGRPLYLSVTVPQPAAEVLVDGVKTSMTGTDRLYESPPLTGDKEYAYDVVVRWIEGGATMERKKTVTGKPGEVVRVDLSK